MMKPQICENCNGREFLEQDDAYVCAYCDTRFPKTSADKPKAPRYDTVYVPAAQPREVEVSVEQNPSAPPVVGKQKNKWVALLLWFVLGVYGAHKFYEGKIGMGLLYLFTGGLFGIGWIVDLFVLLFKPNPYYV